MDVGIVGAGLAGLAAAIALRRSGHTVEIFERSQFTNEVGAAVAIPPNGSRILRDWGFNFDKAQAVPETLMRFMGSDSLKVLVQSSYEDCQEKYGCPWYNIHRVDIHNQLKELAESADGLGQPVKVRLDSEVICIDFENTVIEINGQKRFRKDLIVLADGSHCKHLEELNGSAVPMISSGMTVYRTLIPFEKVKANPSLKSIWENQPPGFLLVLDFATRYLTVIYPCRDATLLNVVFLRESTEEEMGAHGDDWHHPSSKEEIKGYLKGTGHLALWHDFFDLADNVKKFQIMTHDTLDCLYRGKVVAIGDAAHPMLPTHAEGGAMAFEDAAALGKIFPSSVKSDQIEQRLQIYQEVRFARSMVTQMMSNNRTNVMSHAKQEERARQWGYDGELPKDNAHYYKPDFRDFFYAYRVDIEAEKALAAHGLD